LIPLNQAGSVIFRSQRFIPTLKQVPGDVQVLSHAFMLRSGMIRQLGSGAYTKLPLGLEVAKRLECVVSEEMYSRGAEQIHFPAVQPVSIWRIAGRYESYGADMFSFLDRHGRETCFAPTHEIAAALLAAADVHSYRDLPLRLYQLQLKYRDEVRPRGGVLRTREFTMHDLYTFDIDEVSSRENYALFFDSYQAIFRRIGLPVVPVETSDTGAIGGSMSHEFLFPTKVGESDLPDGMSEDPSLRGLEVAHTFQLGTQYAEKLGAAAQNSSGQAVPIWMCSYGLGIERSIAAVVEHALTTTKQVVWPAVLAPYHVNIIVLSDDKQALNLTVAKTAAQCAAAGLRTMVDDRAERAGLKFADSALLGARWEVVFGNRYPNVEVRDHCTGNVLEVNDDAIVSQISRARGEHPF
jgi:prolyl-tRNA synthetase